MVLGMTQAPEQSTAKGWMPDDSTFGARLALVRQRMQWGNVREAAVACGIPAESWRTWERDGVVPRRIVEMSSLIANRTGCDYDWLLSGPRRTSGPASVSVRNPHMAIRSPITHTPSHHRPHGRDDSRRPDTIRRTARLPRPDQHGQD